MSSGGAYPSLCPSHQTPTEREHPPANIDSTPPQNGHPHPYHAHMAIPRLVCPPTLGQLFQSLGKEETALPFQRPLAAWSVHIHTSSCVRLPQCLKCCDIINLPELNAEVSSKHSEQGYQVSLGCVPPRVTTCGPCSGPTWEKEKTDSLLQVVL